MCVGGSPARGSREKQEGTCRDMWPQRSGWGPVGERPTLSGLLALAVHYSQLGRDFPGGAVVKNLPANVGDTGSSPDLGRFHMPWSN